jgi:hypothetical protein
LQRVAAFKTMKNIQSKTHVAISKEGDVLIQGPGCPVLFFARSQVPALLSTPETATALVIVDVGAAAVETVLAAGADFEATIVENESSVISSAVLKFRLPNGLVVGYITDEAIANSRERLAQLGVDLAVTDNSVNWERQQATLIGEIISSVPKVPPQVAGLHRFNAQRLAQLVRDALDQRKSRLTTKSDEKEENT